MVFVFLFLTLLSVITSSGVQVAANGIISLFLLKMSSILFYICAIYAVSVHLLIDI